MFHVAQKVWGRNGEILGDRLGGHGSGFTRLSRGILTAAVRRAMLKAHSSPHAQMSEEQLKAFLEAVSADAGLQEKLMTACNSDEIGAIAKGSGVIISTEGLIKAQMEIAEEELEGVAGGRWRHSTYG